MKVYVFEPVICGVGNNMNEAWLDAITALCTDPGDPPLPTDVEDCEDCE